MMGEDMAESEDKATNDAAMLVVRYSEWRVYGTAEMSETGDPLSESL